MDGCTDIQDPANMSLKGHMLSHRTLSLETLLWARRVCWPCKFPPQTCKAHQARSDQPRFMQALSLEQVIADSAPLSCLIGDVRGSASVLTRIRGYVGRTVTSAGPQMATIIDNPIQAAAVHWGLKVSLQRLPLKALALMCPLVADFSCRRALYQHCGRRRALQWHPPWTRNMRRSFEGS